MSDDVPPELLAILQRVRDRGIPGAAEWQGYEDDLDACDAYELMAGRTLDEVSEHFRDTVSIMHAGELRCSPRGAFSYYVFAHAAFLLSESAAAESDSASSFLRLLISREELDPGSVKELYAELGPLARFVASRQAYFDADLRIYGDFNELSVRLDALCVQVRARDPTAPDDRPAAAPAARRTCARTPRSAGR